MGWYQNLRPAGSVTSRQVSSLGSLHAASLLAVLCQYAAPSYISAVASSEGSSAGVSVVVRSEA